MKNLTKKINPNSVVENIDIIESHHKYKKNAPSGGALLLGDVSAKNVNYHSLRRANIIGEHDVIFSFVNETLKLSHVAHSCLAFVDGVLGSYKFMHNKECGFLLWII